MIKTRRIHSIIDKRISVNYILLSIPVGPLSQAHFDRFFYALSKIHSTGKSAI
jgi:hypothetical protein